MPHTEKLQVVKIMNMSCSGYVILYIDIYIYTYHVIWVHNSMPCYMYYYKFKYF